MKNYECFITHHLPPIEVRAESEVIAQMLIVKQISKKIKESDFENLDIRIKEKGRGLFKQFLEENF